MRFLRSYLVLQTCLGLAGTGCGGTEEPASPSSGGSATGATGGSSGSAGTPSGGAAGTPSGGTGTGGAGMGGTGGAGMGGTGGQGPAGGSSGAPGGGAGSSAGSSGGGAAGSGGGQTTGDCKFAIKSSTSQAIPTVGIVEWSTDLAGLTEASIEFELDDARADELNRGSGGPIDAGSGRALLLGMKPQRSYTFRIVAKAGSTVCTSEDQSITTGARPSNLPAITRRVQNAAAIDPGFIITSPGIALGGPGGGGSQAVAYIFDADGDIVWWTPAPTNCSRALMSYEGTDMWMLELNVENSGGEMRRVSMDGLDVEMNVEGLSRVHHDFTVLPGGIVAGPSWVSNGRDPPSDLIERSPDGTIRTVVTIDESLYRSNTYHTNAIVYYPDTDTYTLGDRNPNAFVKISRSGEVLWQFGGNCSNAPAPKCAAGNWQVNHGHHLLPNGNFVFFNNGAGMASTSTAYEYALDESANALAPREVWSYSAAGVGSMVLGDVQRLPSGNTIVIYSNAGDIHEVDPQGQFVQAFETNSMGYANFRKTLYGPPLR